MVVKTGIFNWDDFLGGLNQAETRQEAKQIFDNLLNKEGLSLSLYADIQEPDNMADSVLFLDNFPTEFMERYIERGYANHDAASKHCLSSSQPYIWSAYDKQLKGIERIVREEAKESGLKAGITFPLHHATNTAPATLSLATDGDINEFNEYVEHNMDSLYLVGVYFHSVLQTLSSLAQEKSIPKLSKRQIEVLKWVSNNKRSKEIADLMNLSERTVNLHIGIAMKKLSAKSRFEAAAVANKYGLI